MRVHPSAFPPNALRAVARISAALITLALLHARGVGRRAKLGMGNSLLGGVKCATSDSP